MSLTKDPLLTAARVVLTLIFVVLIVAMAMLGVGVGACLTVARGELLAELGKAGAPATAYWAVLAIMLLLEATLYLGIRFVRELSGIVRSVDEGDPFRPDTAERLQRMGWIGVAAYALTLMVGAIAAWIEAVSERANGFDFDVSLGSGGIVLILTLFILARVFRQGAAMREELEGTV